LVELLVNLRNHFKEDGSLFYRFNKVLELAKLLVVLKKWCSLAVFVEPIDAFVDFIEEGLTESFINEGHPGAAITQLVTNLVGIPFEVITGFFPVKILLIGQKELLFDVLADLSLLRSQCVRRSFPRDS